MYTLVPRPQGQNIIKTRWLFKVKLKVDGTLDQLKARWVTKGFTQRYRVNYDKIFAPVICTESLHFYLTRLREEIYTEQPEGYINKDHPNHICHLQKSLYGLKQAPYIWNHKINEHLHTTGYQTMDSDPCIYIKVTNRQITIITLYINNCTLITHSKLMDTTKHDLHTKFDMVNLGKAKSILRLKIHQHNSALYLHQSSNINKILNTFSMDNSHAIGTPMVPSLHLPTINTTPPKMHNTPYHKTISKLSYLVHTSIPTSHTPSINYLSHFSNTFNNKHWSTIKHLIHYLRRTHNLALTYQANCYNASNWTTLIPTGFTNTNWGDDPLTCKSVMGLVFMLCGAAISWSSQLQKCVALSSTEAELNALLDAA